MDRADRRIAKFRALKMLSLSADDRKQLAVRLRAPASGRQELSENRRTARGGRQTARRDVKESGAEFAAPAVVQGRDGKTYPAVMPRVRVDSPAEAGKACSLLGELNTVPAGTATLTDLQRAVKEQRREDQREQRPAYRIALPA
jgi:hypothetical protein